MDRYFPIRVNGSVIIPRMMTIAVVWITLSFLLACTPTRSVQNEFSPIKTGGKEPAKQKEIDPTKLERAKWASAAYAGEAEAEFRLGRTYCCGSDETDLKEASKWICKAAKKSYPDAVFTMAEIYSGHDEVADHKLALAYAEAARKLGQASALKGKVNLMKKLTPPEINDAINLAQSFPDLPCEITKKVASNIKQKTFFHSSLNESATLKDASTETHFKPLNPNPVRILNLENNTTELVHANVSTDPHIQFLSPSSQPNGGAKNNSIQMIGAETPALN